MKNIYLLGSLNVDLTIRAPYLPESGETLKGSDFMMTAGGKGANQAYAAAALGGNVKMAGCVGKDAFGDLLINSLRRVDTSYVRRTDALTGAALITVIDGDNRILLHEGANSETGVLDAESLLSHAAAGDIFMTQCETPIDGVIATLKLAKSRGLFTMFNPAPARSEARGAVMYADLITPNRKELKLLSGKDDLEEGIVELLCLGAGAALVTLGEKGSLYVSARERIEVPSCNMGAVVDTTGAGDTYCGALAAELARGVKIADAMSFASRAAGITVTRRGAMVSIPTRDEVL